MTSPKKEFASWAQALHELLEKLPFQDFGYPLGLNQVRKPVFPIPQLPDELKALYIVSDGISLPDIHVGYFIDSAQRSASAAARGEPTRIEGPNHFNIHVFGSNGGGGRFALRTDDGSIYYLPASGAVKDGIFFENKSVAIKKIAPTLIDFLKLLYDDADAFIQNRQDHIYIAS